MAQVVHSDDAFAPVAYLNLCKMHLEHKASDEQVCVRFASDFITVYDTI